MIKQPPNNDPENDLSRFAAGPTDLKVLSRYKRTTSNLTPQEIADNEAHDAGMAVIRAALKTQVG